MFTVTKTNKYNTQSTNYRELWAARQAMKIAAFYGDQVNLTSDEPIPPSDAECIAAGIQDRGYQTTRNGWVESYDGEALVTSAADGSTWRVTGHGPKGDSQFLAQRGWIEKNLITE